MVLESPSSSLSALVLVSFQTHSGASYVQVNPDCSGPRPPLVWTLPEPMAIAHHGRVWPSLPKAQVCELASIASMSPGTARMLDPGETYGLSSLWTPNATRARSFLKFPPVFARGWADITAKPVLMGGK